MSDTHDTTMSDTAEVPGTCSQCGKSFPNLRGHRCGVDEFGRLTEHSAYGLSLGEEIQMVLHQIGMTEHRADRRPIHFGVIDTPTLEEWRERTEWCRDLLKRLVAAAAGNDKPQDEALTDAESVSRLQEENARLKGEIEPAKDLIASDAAFQEWAQGHLKSWKWAGHDRADAVKQELLEAEAALSRLTSAVHGLVEKWREEVAQLNKAEQLLEQGIDGSAIRAAASSCGVCADELAAILTDAKVK